LTRPKAKGLFRERGAGKGFLQLAGRRLGGLTPQLRRVVLTRPKAKGLFRERGAGKGFLQLAGRRLGGLTPQLRRVVLTRPKAKGLFREGEAEKSDGGVVITACSPITRKK
jgi:hypothetical protein